MTAVTVDFRLINSAGHHRQPRTGPTWTTLPGGYLTDSTPGTTAQATAGVVPDATFLFWSASDGEGGAATENTTINQTVGNNPLTLTAWYLPNGGGTGKPVVLLDAFSLTIGDFVDDDFVTVTSDPALTSAANVAGVVPTSSPQSLEAFGSVHGQNFVEWIGAGSDAGQTLSLDAGSVGFAIATYRAKKISVIHPDIHLIEGWIVIGGVTVDGGGWVIPIGGGGGGGPVGPWGPFIGDLGQLLNIAVSAYRLGKDGLGMQREVLDKISTLARVQSGLIGG